MTGIFHHGSQQELESSPGGFHSMIVMSLIYPLVT